MFVENTIPPSALYMPHMYILRSIVLVTFYRICVLRFCNALWSNLGNDGTRPIQSCTPRRTKQENCNSQSLIVQLCQQEIQSLTDNSVHQESPQHLEKRIHKKQSFQKHINLNKNAPLPQVPTHKQASQHLRTTIASPCEATMSLEFILWMNMDYCSTGGKEDSMFV